MYDGLGVGEGAKMLYTISRTYSSPSMDHVPKSCSRLNDPEEPETPEVLVISDLIQ